MTVKKLGLVKRLLLKNKDKEQYRNYKFMLALQKAPHLDLQDIDRPDIHFKHSGNIGDIIYSLPAVFALAKGRNIHLHLHINQKANYGKMRHPLGDVMMTEKMAAMICPLLLAQPSFKTCDVFTDQPIDYDLDIFRAYPFDYKMGHIVRWYFSVFAVTADLTKPWLKAAPDASLNDAIIVARSHRYRMPAIDYSFLNRYPRVVFVGLEEEFRDMKKTILKLEYKPVKDFFELASIIAGGKFFVGNQSFPFAVAEGLKVKRVLEVFYQSPNVIVEGENAYDFCYQPQFEKIVDRMYNEK